eukprot:g2638.t1
MTTAHRPTFHNALGGENQGGNLLSAPTTKKMARDIPQELTMKTRHQKEKTRAELLQEVEEKELLNTEGGGDSDYEALQLELAKIRQEKEDARLKAEAEAEREQEQDRKAGIGEANPLLNKNQSLKRSWNEDSIFKNQSRTAPKQQRRFINDNVRSDFHKRFLNKYMAM